VKAIWIMFPIGLPSAMPCQPDQDGFDDHTRKRGVCATSSFFFWPLTLRLAGCAVHECTRALFPGYLGTSSGVPRNDPCHDGFKCLVRG